MRLHAKPFVSIYHLKCTGTSLCVHSAAHAGSKILGHSRRSARRHACSETCSRQAQATLRQWTHLLSAHTVTTKVTLCLPCSGRRNRVWRHKHGALCGFHLAYLSLRNICRATLKRRAQMGIGARAVTPTRLSLKSASGAQYNLWSRSPQSSSM